MPDFKAARINMVDSQIHTMGVVNDDILEAFRTVRREDYVPANRRAVAYNDEDLPVAKGRCLMEPVTQARLIQAVIPQPADKVMDVGGATGYSAAILSQLTTHVTAVEPDANLLAAAEQTWLQQGLTNILSHNGPINEGCNANGPYSLIFINGSMSEIPKSLTDQLALHGRLVGVIRGRDDRIGRAVLVSKNGNGSISERILFDAAVPYLPGYQPRNEFVF